MSKHIGNVQPRLFILTAVVLGLATVAIACGGGEAKGHSAQTTTPSAGTKAPSATSSPGATAVQIKMIPTLKFDKTSLTIAANADVTVSVDNTDTGMQHNFAVYKSKADAEAGKPAIAESKICAGPCQETLTLHLAPGEYFFHCDVHPTQMTGMLTVK